MATPILKLPIPTCPWSHTCSLLSWSQHLSPYCFPPSGKNNPWQTPFIADKSPRQATCLPGCSGFNGPDPVSPSHEAKLLEQQPLSPIHTSSSHTLRVATLTPGCFQCRPHALQGFLQPVALVATVTFSRHWVDCESISGPVPWLLTPHRGSAGPFYLIFSLSTLDTQPQGGCPLGGWAGHLSI